MIVRMQTVVGYLISHLFKAAFWHWIETRTESQAFMALFDLGLRIIFLWSCLLGRSSSSASAFVASDPTITCRKCLFFTLRPATRERPFLSVPAKVSVGQLFAKRKAAADAGLVEQVQEDRKRPAAKKNTKLIEEFALRASILLRESGGRMPSEVFQTRWKCTFPRDDLARYKRGVSLKKLFGQCGDNFMVEEMPSDSGSSSRSVAHMHSRLCILPSFILCSRCCLRTHRQIFHLKMEFLPEILLVDEPETNRFVRSLCACACASVYRYLCTYV